MVKITNIEFQVLPDKFTGYVMGAYVTINYCIKIKNVFITEEKGVRLPDSLECTDEFKEYLIREVLGKYEGLTLQEYKNLT